MASWLAPETKTPDADPLVATVHLSPAASHSWCSSRASCPALRPPLSPPVRPVTTEDNSLSTAGRYSRLEEPADQHLSSRVVRTAALRSTHSRARATLPPKREVKNAASALGGLPMGRGRATRAGLRRRSAEIHHRGQRDEILQGGERRMVQP
jgi:hypothetical protein